MSASPSPPPSILYDSVEVVPDLSLQPLQNSTSSLTAVTRTLAIIKTHALAHRFDIERRIQEASFEIVKERQMEFDTESDPDILYELFGEDADALAEGPVWVYVLERRRAVEVWSTLMGDRDFEVARHDAPNSLRALYGLSSEQNGLMGSSDNETAEMQIAALFASSPPFPTTDLPGEDRYGSMRSISSSILASLRKATQDEGYAPSTATNPSTVNGGSQTKVDGNGKVVFKARPLPATHDKPDIVPRTTRAAALRAGQAVEIFPATPRGPVSKERLAETFANVPGHKRTNTIAVASTAPPTIAPRMTRAASLRLGQAPPPPVVRKRASTNEGKTKNGTTNIFDGVPGHRRRESISVASVKAPTVAPRLNKSAALRVSKEQGPPTSYMFRAPVAPRPPALSPTNSKGSLSPPRQAIPRPASQASVAATPSRYAIDRSASVTAIRPASSSAAKVTARPSAVSQSPENTSLTSAAAPTTTAKPKPRPSSIAGPNIPPRTNRSAALRAAKQEAEAAAAAAAAARKPIRKGPPSSFKPIAA